MEWICNESVRAFGSFVDVICYVFNPISHFCLCLFLFYVPCFPLVFFSFLEVPLTGAYAFWAESLMFERVFRDGERLVVDLFSRLEAPLVVVWPLSEFFVFLLSVYVLSYVSLGWQVGI